MNKHVTAVRRVERIVPDSGTWYKWILHYSVAEQLGIGAATVICRLLLFEFSDKMAEAPSYLIPLILATSGLAEGLLLGYLQWSGFVNLGAGLNKKAWLAVSAMSMLIAWLIVIPLALILIPLFILLSREMEFYTLLSVATFGLSFGGIIGIGQLFVLRKFYTNASAWVLANAIGWMFSFLVVYLSLVTMEQMRSTWINVLLMVMACVVSGAIQGIISGLSLRSVMALRESRGNTSAE